MNDTTATPTRREPRGAVEYTGANAKFLHIKYGCICEVSKTPVEGWVHPINQKTAEEIADKWIKVYKNVEAWINKLEWYDRTHGEEVYQGWKLHMSAGDTNYVLDLPLNSAATKKFMLSARNIDYEVPFEIAAWIDRETGKLAVWLKQNDKTVLQYYKKGDMKECPEPVKRVGIGGKEKWDWEETDTFLWNEMQNRIAPHIEKTAKDRGYVAPEARAEPSTPPYSGPAGAVEPDMPPMSASDDDIPF